MLADFYEWAVNAGIEISDQTIIKHAKLHYKDTASGKVVVVLLEMKPGAVTFPDGLTEYTGELTMGD
jgi:hypothetical protein